MIHQNLYTFPSISVAMPHRELQSIYTFLLRNLTVFPDATWRREAFSNRRQMTTTSGELFHTIVAHFGADYFRPFIIGKSIPIVPEYATHTTTTLDSRQAADAIPALGPALAPFSDLVNKLHTPVTDLCGADGTLRDYVAFQNRVVRDFLSRSFYATNRKNWLNIAILQYVSKVYSMTIRRTIGSRFNLDTPRQLEAAYVFLYYFIGKMTDPELAEGIMVANRREIGLGDPSDITQVIGFIKEELDGKPLDQFPMIFPILAKLNPDLKRLTLEVMVNYTRGLSSDVFGGIMALEYPPLFVYLLIQAASGEYVGIRRTMQDANLIKPGVTVFERLQRDIPSFMV